MVLVTQLRAGRSFRLDGRLFYVLKYEHSKIGRGTANVRVKVRDLESGAVLDKTFMSGAKVELLETQVRSLQFLWSDKKTFSFMNPITFEQMELPEEVIGEAKVYLQEGREVRVLFADDKPLSIELPPAMVFEVSESPPGVKGDTASGATKSVVLENGLEVRTPLFIKKGDKIKVDTRTKEYVERVNS